MSALQVFLYTLAFVAVTVGISLPAIKWYKRNVGMEMKKKFSIMLIFLTVVVLLALFISDMF